VQVHCGDCYSPQGAARFGIRTSGGFDSHRSDCDVRELANPVHCECILDGIETRTSPKLSPAARARCLLSRSEARSTRAESAPCLVSQLVWTPACRAEERDSISLRGATGPSEGRNEASKTSELGSIPSEPATGSDAEGCCSALQAERLGALPSDSTAVLVAVGRGASWYDAPNGFDSRSQLPASEV
jgi:hypothetical protein